MRFAAPSALALVLLTSEAQAAADPARYMPTELVVESSQPRPGTTVLVGFRMMPRPGWHGYWSNPGDSGITPTVEWNAPPGVSFSPLMHPAPSLLVGGGIASFVHDGPHVLLSRMSVPRSVAPGTVIPAKAKLSWAACTASQCVPLQATFTLNLVAGDGAKGNGAAILRTALRRVPQTGPRGTYWTDRNSVHLALPSPLGLRASAVRFFPDDNDTFATDRAQVATDNGELTLIAPAAPALSKSLGGVVSDGRKSYRMVFDPVARPAADAVEAEAADKPQLRLNETAADAVRHTSSASVKQPEKANHDLERPARSQALAIAVTAALVLMGAGLAMRLR